MFLAISEVLTMLTTIFKQLACSTSYTSMRLHAHRGPCGCSTLWAHEYLPVSSTWKTALANLKSLHKVLTQSTGFRVCFAFLYLADSQCLNSLACKYTLKKYILQNNLRSKPYVQSEVWCLNAFSISILFSNTHTTCTYWRIWQVSSKSCELTKSFLSARLWQEILTRVLTRVL